MVETSVVSEWISLLDGGTYTAWTYFRKAVFHEEMRQQTDRLLHLTSEHLFEEQLVEVPTIVDMMSMQLLLVDNL